MRQKKRYIIKRASILLVVFSLSVFYSHLAFSSGIGFFNFGGNITVTNSTLSGNSIGIQLTTTNAASIANKTIDHLRIYNNNVKDSRLYGMRLDPNQSGVVTINKNTLDNFNVPSTGPYTKNGRYGIRIRNHPGLSLANNTVQNFGRSGIQLQNIDGITAVNNYLFSNGSQNVYSEIIDQQKRYYGSGLQAIDSVFSSIANNIIASNHF